jgi:hypothetical protein
LLVSAGTQGCALFWRTHSVLIVTHRSLFR